MILTRLQIAVGVILDVPEQRVLIARRPEHVHQGGLWEFPGGKCLAGEKVATALERELKEELNLQVVHAEPFMKLEYDYPEQPVMLHTWIVDRWEGEPSGREGQCVEWVPVVELSQRSFPRANEHIIQSLERLIAKK